MKSPNIRRWFPLIAAVGCNFLMASSASAQAQQPNALPPIVQSGLTAYTIGGPGAALNAWLKGGPLEEHRQSAPQPEVLHEFERLFGKYKSSEIIDSRDIGTSSKLVYLAINYERGAAFASFLTFRAGGHWVIQQMEFSRKPESIMPWLVLSGGK